VSRIAAGLAALAVLALAGPASAHTRSVSYSTWTLQGNSATVRVRMTALDANALALWIDGAPLATHLQSAVVLSAAATPCAPVADSLHELRADAGAVRYEWRVRCASAARLAVRSDLLFDVVPAHVHFARVGEVELTLSEHSRSAAVPAQAGGLASVGRFIGLGVEHIFGGLDHLVFLLMLILVARRLADVGFAVTGFTVGHSVTLALATLGYAAADERTVEALIGLSIALVAVENVWVSRGDRGIALPAVAVAAIAATAAIAPFALGISGLALAGVALFAACYFGLLARSHRPARLRSAVAGLFGLVHGFGFAGALLQLELPPARAVAPLLGFNLGVELGQLAAVALVWPVVLLARRLGPRADRATVVWGSAAALAAGTFWFVSRAHGG